LDEHIVALPILIVLLLFFTIRRIVDMNKIEIEKIKVAKEAEVKALYIKEIEHRIKNNLQLIHNIIDFNLFKSNQNETKQSLNNIKNRLRSISIVHNYIYNLDDMNNIKICSAISDLIKSISNCYIDTSITYKLNCNNICLKTNKAVTVCIILNEIITNSYKYAFNNQQNGIINCEITRNNNDIRLIVSDNGSGISKEIDAHTSKTIGLKLIRDLVILQLSGNIEINNDNGTEYVIDFEDHSA
jgi:two-component sensor histidine kinase